MKSRWTLRLLAAAVAVVWGLVAWRIFAPGRQAVPDGTPASPPGERPEVAAETLRADYPDPFLKGAASPAPLRRQPVRPLHSRPKRLRRTPPHAVHLATVSAAGREYHILTFDGRPCELQRGDTVAGFRLRGADADSLYFEREGVVYGVKRCER